MSEAVESLEQAGWRRGKEETTAGKDCHLSARRTSRAAPAVQQSSCRRQEEPAGVCDGETCEVLTSPSSQVCDGRTRDILFPVASSRSDESEIHLNDDWNVYARALPPNSLPVSLSSTHLKDQA